MPPATAPIAPAMPSAPGGGGIEARPAVPASTPPPPEVSMDPARVAARQQEVARIASLPPDAVLADLDHAHEAARTAGAAPEAAGNGAGIRATAEERAALQQKAFKEITDMNLGIDLATASPTQIMDALKQRGWDEKASFDYAMGARDQAIALRQEEARQKITAPGMGITLTADTNIDDLMRQVVEKGWTPDEPTKAYVQGALDLVKKEAGQPAVAEQQTGVNGNAAVAESEHPAVTQQGEAQAATPANENAAPSGAAEATTANQQAGQEVVSASQPSEETIQQALRAMGKADTPANREEAKRLIAAKAEADAKAVAEKFGKKKEKELLPEEQKLMEGMSKLVAENTDEAQKWLDVLAREDPVYFKWLKEKLDIYKKQENAKKSKYYMAAGIMGFLMYLVYNTLTTSEGH